MLNYTEQFLEIIKQRDPDQPEFLQAVREVAESVIPWLHQNADYKIYLEHKILERIAEPERVITFRVPWVDDHGTVQINRGFRIQMNSALGPYKGGLRFHPSVNLSILKFLAFEQVFKNSLTTLSLGGGKGGSDFDPKNKSDLEIMRFCHSFMNELYRHIGENTDVPAGDIGVGAREIGFLFGHYKKLSNQFTGVLTGKSILFGGSLIRPEATGYGCVYFVENMLLKNNNSLRNKKVLISGSGNVAQYAAEKVIELGGIILTMSDSDGFIYDSDSQGINQEKLEFIKNLKNNQRGRISEYCKKYNNAQFYAHKKPWIIAADIALPCATQNELDLQDAELLIKNNSNFLAVAEGANMPCTLEATHYLQQNNILFAPGKASNAGGVAVSGLEMSQNSMRLSWSREQVDQKLREIIKNIHDCCVKYGEDININNKNKFINYVQGANRSAFLKIADAMLAQGVV